MPLLSDLIDLPTCPLVAIIGAGGKTTTMYTLARELAHRMANVSLRPQPLRYSIPSQVKQIN